MELFHLDEDFAETNDLAATYPEKLAPWSSSGGRGREAHVLPLDDRLRERFVVNANRFFHGPASVRVPSGMGICPQRSPLTSAVAVLIEADVHITEACQVSHRPWRCDHRLQPVSAVRPSGARHEYRRGACDRKIGGAGYREVSTDSASVCIVSARAAADHQHRPGFSESRC